jgi:hypothetical protein
MIRVVLTSAAVTPIKKVTLSTRSAPGIPIIDY